MNLLLYRTITSTSALLQSGRAMTTTRILTLNVHKSIVPYKFSSLSRSYFTNLSRVNLISICRTSKAPSPSLLRMFFSRFHSISKLKHANVVNCRLLKWRELQSNPCLHLSSLPNNRQILMNRDRNKSALMLMTAVVVIVLGLAYAAVPLYRIYCQRTKTGGQAVLEDNINQKVAAMQKVEDRKISIRFEAEKSSRLAWDFKPSQTVITCSPGETVLAFYTARNHLDRPVNGIATYTILPYEAGKYFNKIQCFCFEEQQLNAEEEVDLPVFFYIDPEYNKDPYLFENNDIVLSYNFFETKEGYKLPKPPSFRAHLPALTSTAPPTIPTPNVPNSAVATVA